MYEAIRLSLAVSEMRACAFASSTVIGSSVGAAVRVQAQPMSRPITASFQLRGFGLSRVGFDGAFRDVLRHELRVHAIDQPEQIGRRFLDADHLSRLEGRIRRLSGR